MPNGPPLHNDTGRQRGWPSVSNSDWETLQPSLRTLLDEYGTGSFDFAFIDADKTAYRSYCELALDLLRPGGLLLIDNVLWGGRVIDPDEQDADTQAIRDLNQWFAW